jgi:formate hydrogenlyase subunit 3/multisubunit Na+/H+ antiporter MnhD subunit|tara:strand:- start:224 stop:649 length:426 start_codon:yes stop_codon:yes gene_type:complete
MDEGLFIALASGAICIPVILVVIYALKLFVEWMFLRKELEIKTKHLLIGLGVPILSIPVTFMIPGIFDFCKFDFGSGCNVVSDGVFSFFFFLPFLVSLAMIVYSIRIEEKSVKKWAQISAVLTFMYAVAMEFLMLVALQTI